MTNLYPKFSFTINKTDDFSDARLGVINTPHGKVETPAFIFCATKGAIKGTTVRDVKEAGTQIILSNTYHMMLQPGAEVVRSLGGLHKFLGWDGPMLTDSGGFQIFSLGHGSVAAEVKGRRQNTRPKTLLSITEQGAEFKSYLDGRKHLLTPELSIEVQSALGPDLVVVLDECTPFHVDKEYTQRSLDLSHRWAIRSLDAFKKINDGRQALYGISQGGIYPDLRKLAAEFLNNEPFFGYAVGGSLGATPEQMREVIAMAMEPLSKNRPVHLLGIGSYKDILEGVARGIDTFDCVHPTRLARHGGALLPPYLLGKDSINLKNARYKLDTSPILEDCPCYTCKNHTRAYIHHMLKARELVAVQLLTIHNIAFMNNFMLSIRKAIASNKLQDMRKKWLCV